MNSSIRWYLVACLLFTAFASLARAENEEPIVREFATNFGPIRLTFRGNAVTGTYRISTKPELNPGDINDTLRDGLLDGVWSEPRSRGRILIAFSADFSRIHVLYTHDPHPGNWEGEWTGVNLKNLATVPESLRNRMRAE